MKVVLSIFIAALLALGGISITGCANDQNQSAGQGSTAGGNGAFGESPARPGSYSGDQYNQSSNAPATQPANR